jgi:hypothetical protein
VSPAQRRAELDLLFDQASQLLTRAGEQMRISQEVLLGTRDRGLRRRAVFGGRRWGSR